MKKGRAKGKGCDGAVVAAEREGDGDLQLKCGVCGKESLGVCFLGIFFVLLREILEYMCFR